MVDPNDQGIETTPSAELPSAVADYLAAGEIADEDLRTRFQTAAVRELVAIVETQEKGWDIFGATLEGLAQASSAEVAEGFFRAASSRLFEGPSRSEALVVLGMEKIDLVYITEGLSEEERAAHSLAIIDHLIQVTASKKPEDRIHHLGSLENGFRGFADTLRLPVLRARLETLAAIEADYHSFLRHAAWVALSALEYGGPDEVQSALTQIERGLVDPREHNVVESGSALFTIASNEKVKALDPDFRLKLADWVKRTIEQEHPSGYVPGADLFKIGSIVAYFDFKELATAAFREAFKSQDFERHHFLSGSRAGLDWGPQEGQAKAVVAALRAVDLATLPAGYKILAEIQSPHRLRELSLQDLDAINTAVDDLVTFVEAQVTRAIHEALAVPREPQTETEIGVTAKNAQMVLEQLAGLSDQVRAYRQE